jgi:mannitol-1-phosphate/altronate dehydrogenase
LHDALFTAQGYQAYADDLLERMVNPNLNDLVSRVGRDHVRKLGYEDRLYGTMNLALHYGVQPKNLALGAAAGILSMIKRQGSFEKPVPHLPKTESELSEPLLRELLRSLWASKVDQQGEQLISLTWDALKSLRSI